MIPRTVVGKFLLSDAELISTSMLKLILLMLMLLRQVSAQNLTVSSQDSTIRIAGQGLFSRSCRYIGNDTSFLRLDWYLSGSLHPSGMGVMGSKLNRLVIQPPTTNDAGMYYCIALFSDNNTVPISGGSLRIFSPAQVIYAPAIQIVLAGDSIVLNCSTTFPRHQIFITWLYNTSTISNVINNASLEHAGQYNCLIYETVTSVVIYRANIQLVVIDVRVSSINDTVQMLGRGNFSRICTYNGNDTHFTRLDWSLNGNTHSMGMGDVGMKYNHLFIQQPTIEDAGEYACSAIFSNYSSIPVSAGSLRFLLLPGPPFNVNLISSSIDSLTIQAQLSNIGTIPILSAHLMITSPGDNFIEVYNVTEDLSLGQVVEFVVNDLSPDTTYSVLVYAVNTVGRGQDSERRNFMTSNLTTMITPTPSDTPYGLAATSSTTPAENVAVWTIMLQSFLSLVIIFGIDQSTGNKD